MPEQYEKPKIFEDYKKAECLKALKEGRLARLWNDGNYNLIIPDNLMVNTKNLPTPRTVCIPSESWEDEDSEEDPEKVLEEKVKEILPEGINAFATGYGIDAPENMIGWVIQFYELIEKQGE